jgi:DNA-binding NtrC family response regulator
MQYRWPGNIRQLRNVAEQISVLEKERNITASELRAYLPSNAASANLPAVVDAGRKQGDFSNEREILYKVLFDMKSDLNDLKKLTLELLKHDNSQQVQEENEQLIQKIYGQNGDKSEEKSAIAVLPPARAEVEITGPAASRPAGDKYHFAEEIEEEETLSLQQKEIELIAKSLERNKGKRKAAAAELGISERTLYRKIKQYDL